MMEFAAYVLMIVASTIWSAFGFAIVVSSIVDWKKRRKDWEETNRICEDSMKVINAIHDDVDMTIATLCYGQDTASFSRAGYRVSGQDFGNCISVTVSIDKENSMVCDPINGNG